MAKTDFSHTYVTAESNDEKLINNLLAVKKQAKLWKYKRFYCQERIIGGDPIPNMIVIHGKLNDTIFTDYTNRWLIFPDEGKAYYDEESLLLKSFRNNIKEFFEHNFETRIRALFLPEKDSISIGKIFYKEKKVMNFLKDFENDLNDFKLARRDSVYGSVERVYTYNNDTVSFYEREIDITISDLKSGWIIDDIKVGMQEKELLKKYPVSTKIKLFGKTKFEDIKREYFYWLGVANTRVNITFKIKDNIIDSIIVNLYDEIPSN